ncbi:MAG TPA: DEAD/DEAH box helicase [Solirubrobacteraceae bacterium]|nr:DEAD/DEAH box helicase [Solirubrobacteraceae bacterium]
MTDDRDEEPWRALLEAARADGAVAHEALEAGRPARTAAIPDGLHPQLRAALARSGVERLYSHQLAALEAAVDAPTITTTGTASGKSLCFNLPTLETLARRPSARAIYLYPTKALAQDQARSLAALRMPTLVPAIYDGDTPREARAQVRRTANVVLTNPDMLHVGILPNHAAWESLFTNLTAVVIDEAHAYRGVFGSHVANVLRRLRRIAAAYGSEPRFMLTSATVANPLDLAQRLTGLDGFAAIDDDGSPGLARRIALVNPPLTDERTGARASTLAQAAALVSELVRGGTRTICFMKSRKGVEVLVRIVREHVGAELGGRVAPYRAGYTSQQRRELEARLSAGDLLAVVATDALELGIDIGRLDAAIVVTFPGTIASLRQMWGRAGRRGTGLAVYVAGEDALDQFLCRHPAELLERPVEAAILDHESGEIYAEHVLCAAHEGPLAGADAEFLGPRWRGAAERLESAGRLRSRHTATGTQYVPASPGDYPAASLSLRSAGGESIAIVDVASGELLGTAEAARAPSAVHDGAVYMHLGRPYLVRELDLGRDRALVEPFDGDWYTQPRQEADTEILALLERREIGDVRLSFGEVAVTETVFAYQRRRLSDHTPIDMHSLQLPPSSFTTQAVWFELDGSDLAELVGQEAVLGALHATEHAQIAALPLLAMCDRWDIGGLSTAAHGQTAGPTVFIYDGHAGGVGIARTAFDRFAELCADAAELVAGCTCERGCPSCVQSPKCGTLNEPLSKAGALLVLEVLLDAQAALPRAIRARSIVRS